MNDRFLAHVARPVQRLKRRFNSHVHDSVFTRYPLEFASGLSSGRDRPLRLEILGRASTVDYLLASLFSSGVTFSRKQYVWGWQLKRLLSQQSRTNLRIVRYHTCRESFAGTNCEWRIPDSVAGIIELEEDGDQAYKYRGNRSNLRRIRKQGFRAVLSFDDSELGDFINNAYIPYTNRRFRDQSRPHAESTIRRAFANGGLLWVEKGGIRQAGVVFSILGDTVYSRVVAPIVDSDEALRSGSLPATYKFLIDYAIAKGFKNVHVGASRPQLFDGVLYHKRSWGARLVDTPEEPGETILSWRNLTPEIIAWLNRAPLIVREDRRLSALTAFPDGFTESQRHRHLTRLWSPGLSAINVVGLDRNVAPWKPINGTKVLSLYCGNRSA